MLAPCEQLLAPCEQLELLTPRERVSSCSVGCEQLIACLLDLCEQLL